ncbi:sphingosine N-acyltransferase lag1 [Aspergillus tanneri]|uniref:Sphingosine N-acyltransferase lag1 n=1 Tax=Aspergillus tanneri TaxID=1220188 RepID=A0A5M9NCU0_9EURO|nr:sphingosine N-acyltransferase lag1 [Aspergillus tanneri]KAA8652407.1 sphingosine N-acyltransferase lag1 [Aspergillus tanneri]
MAKRPGSVSQHRYSFREWMLTHQIGLSLTLIATLLSIHSLYPSLQPYTAPFFQLSYYNAVQNTYRPGGKDISLVVSAALVLTAVRAVAIEWILQPLARRVGLKTKAALRVAEQGWACIYYMIFWPCGMYLWSSSSYWADYSTLWTDWPARDMSGRMKLYLLVQLGLWIQQILVIHIEQRRKDHYQMLIHHLITCALLGSAYTYGFYNVSNVVLCLMDIIDLLLPAAKVLKYLHFEKSCTLAFGTMLLVWLVTRHIFFPQLCWSIYKDVPTHMPYACYSGATGEILLGYPEGYPSSRDTWATYLLYLYPFQDLDGPICMNASIKWAFIASLVALQALSLVWFGMVVRVAMRVLRTGVAEDTRSDDEESRSHGAGATGFDPSVVRRVRDPKALLGRIGCEKPTS